MVCVVTCPACFCFIMSRVNGFDMGRLSVESRNTVIALDLKGFCVIEICERLREENIRVSRQALHNLILKFWNNRTVADLPRRRMQSKITEEMRSVMEEALTNSDEITARGLKNSLVARWPDLQVSTPTIKRVRNKMGWVCTRPHYCQLLCPVSQVVVCTCLYYV